uniref:MerR family transcriptional regulator n=1 Tax=Rhodovarius crocodyli TaxID=1979269 RepID=UPI001F0C6D4C|nr:MerR family transcriptional regulator [Rhodovarius crocodyli]
MRGQEAILGLDATADTAEARVRKGAQAYRTISEVAEDLNVPQHVLRFWEGKFPQLKPLKRGGGRRYYRPEDIALLRRIAGLLYSQGYTIKGVQRLLSDDTAPAADTPAQGVDAAMASLEAVAAELRDLLKRAG